MQLRIYILLITLLPLVGYDKIRRESEDPLQGTSLRKDNSPFLGLLLTGEFLFLVLGRGLSRFLF